MAGEQGDDTGGIVCVCVPSPALSWGHGGDGFVGMLLPGITFCGLAGGGRAKGVGCTLGGGRNDALCGGMLCFGGDAVLQGRVNTPFWGDVMHFRGGDDALF